MTIILVVVLIIILVGSLPQWPHSVEWGYIPSGTALVFLLVVLALLATGRIG